MKIRLMAAREIALALNIGPARVHQIIGSDPTFPAPVATLAVGKIWDADDVEAWARRVGRTLVGVTGDRGVDS